MLTVADHDAPELLYKSTASAEDRRRIQAEVVEDHRVRVAAVVRRYVPFNCRDEGQQVGAVGLLVALERFDPKSGVPFWGFARHLVLDEIQRWLGEGVYWRKSTNRGKSPARQANRDAARLHAVPASIDAPVTAAGDEGSTLHDLVSCTVPIADEQVIKAELNAKLSEFLDTLTADERRLLLCEKRERAGGGVSSGNNARGRHYLSLIRRATASVRGKDDAVSYTRPGEGKR